jgi:predicted phage terminase large subunit-like protein
MKAMGAYMFANQYMNEVIPDELKTFKSEWITYYEKLPDLVYNFITIDPALSEAATSDYTGIVVVAVDTGGNRYVRYAKRHRLSPTELVDMIFTLHDEWKPRSIGIEEVAYQKALLYFVDQEMRRRKIILPITGVKAPTDRSKETKILSLVPWIQWGRLMMNRGLNDLEMELNSFPRGAHDDLLDALANIDQIAITPQEEKKNVRPHPSSQEYESWYRKQLGTKGRPERFDPES